MKIPKSLKIGGLTYKIEEVDEVDDGDSAGKIVGTKQLIQIGHATNDYMKLTLVHEILHAINAEVKESEIEFLAQALYQVIKDNPELFKGGE